MKPPRVAPPINVLGIVLAGGKSSRMGRDKADLPHPRQGTFLQHAITRLSDLGLPVAVSGPSRAASAVAHIEDLQAEQGPAMAVWSCVKYAKQHCYDAVLISPVDMPDVTSDHLRSILAVASSAMAVAGTFDPPVPHPLLALYPVSLEQELEAVAKSARRSLREWLVDRSCTLVTLDVRASRDCNRPQDLLKDTPDVHTVAPE